jgi:hypothetical protein
MDLWRYELVGLDTPAHAVWCLRFGLLDNYTTGVLGSLGLGLTGFGGAADTARYGHGNGIHGRWIPSLVLMAFCFGVLYV